MNWWYRFWQFWTALWAKPKFEDREFVEGILMPSLVPVFECLERSEQAHAIRVCRKLVDEGESDLLLLTAALLHDIGKTRCRLRLWERIWIVLFGWIRKRVGISLVLEDLALDKATWWKRPLIVGQFHPLWGAQLLREQGVDERIVWLVQHHQDGEGIDSTDPWTRWLKKLEKADQIA